MNSNNQASQDIRSKDLRLYNRQLIVIQCFVLIGNENTLK
jgi:hypothetical protein